MVPNFHLPFTTSEFLLPNTLIFPMSGLGLEIICLVNFDLSQDNLVWSSSILNLKLSIPSSTTPRSNNRISSIFNFNTKYFQYPSYFFPIDNSISLNVGSTSGVYPHLKFVLFLRQFHFLNRHPWKTTYIPPITSSKHRHQRILNVGH